MCTRSQIRNARATGGVLIWWNGMGEWNSGMSMRMLRMSCVIGLNILWSLAVVTSQVTKAGIGSGECPIIVTDSETDLDTRIECLMAFPVKVAPGEMF